MNELMNVGNSFNPASFPSDANGLVAEILNAIPMALAAPILKYQTTKAQKESFTIAIEARHQERTAILKTMQILAEFGQLTPEISQQLMVAYYQ